MCCFKLPSRLLIAASCYQLKVAACVLLYPSTPLPPGARTAPLRLPNHRSWLGLGIGRHLLGNPVHLVVMSEPPARPPPGPCPAPSPAQASPRPLPPT